MKNTIQRISGITLLSLVAINTSAKPGDVYVYPADGQSLEQTERDRYECYVWGSKETGFDPSARMKKTANVVRVPVARNEKKGAAITGTIIGAIAGAAIGSHDRRAGTGAIIGAATGTAIGAAVEQSGRDQAVADAEDEARAQSEELAREQQEIAERSADYKRAFSACLEGRGYVVR